MYGNKWKSYFKSRQFSWDQVENGELLSDSDGWSSDNDDEWGNYGNW